MRVETNYSRDGNGSRVRDHVPRKAEAGKRDSSSAATLGAGAERLAGMRRDADADGNT